MLEVFLEDSNISDNSFTDFPELLRLFCLLSLFDFGATFGDLLGSCDEVRVAALSRSTVCWLPSIFGHSTARGLTRPIDSILELLLLHEEASSPSLFLQ